MELHCLFFLDPGLLLRRTKTHREDIFVCTGRMIKVDYSPGGNDLQASYTGIGSLRPIVDCPNRNHSRIIASERQSTLGAY